MAAFTFVRSIDTAERAYEAWERAYGYIGIVYRAHRGWRATSTRGLYPTRAAAASAAYTQALARGHASSIYRRVSATTCPSVDSMTHNGAPWE